MKVLICLEPGRGAEEILRESFTFLKKYPVVYAHIHTIRDVSVLASDTGFDDAMDREFEEEEVDLYKTASSFFGSGKFAFTVGMGIPAEKIIERAEELKCDLLILGTHGRTGIDRILYGSVSEKVLRRVRCKVLIIPIK